MRQMDEQLARLARALAHPARVRIVRLLHHRQACIGCDIVGDLGIAQSTTSEHLRILREAGVVVGRIERPRVCYSLNPQALAPLGAFIAALAHPPAASPGQEEEGAEACRSSNAG